MRTERERERRREGKRNEEEKGEGKRGRTADPVLSAGRVKEDRGREREKEAARKG